MIDIVAVTYKQGHKLKCFIESILSQTSNNYKLHVIHDGPDEEFLSLKYDSVNLIQYPNRTENYGHILRDWALKNIVHNEYVLITNGDNYYTPVMVEEVSKCKEDLIYFDFICHHSTTSNENKSSYGFLKSEMKSCFIDMGSVVVRSELAKKVGFNSTQFGADWDYFNQLLKITNSVTKINKVLLVHN